MGQTTFSGPVVSTNGFTGDVTGDVTGNVTGDVTGDVTAATVAATTSVTVGSGTAITQILKGTVSVTVDTLAAAAEADVDVTVTGAAPGDTVIMTPLDAAAETGLMFNSWVGASDTVTIRMTNASGSQLTGSTTNWQYCIIQS